MQPTTAIVLSSALLLATLGVLECGAQPQNPPAPAFKAGFAERDISPDIGMEEPGGYGKVFHKTFHDACKVRAAVFDDGGARVALVGLDALIVPRHLVLSARRAIQARCGIEPGAILMGASHSHSSGPLGMVQPGEFDDASPLVRQLAYEKSSCADAAYLKRVEREIVEAVSQANDRRSAVRCGFGSGIEGKVGFNRRLRMKNGLCFSHPGKGNPDIIDYAGPIDPEVGVIGAWSADGKLTGCVVNYACHATTNPGGISANWIYYLEKTIRGAFGPDVTVVFLQGACGNITQVDNLGKFENPPPERWAQFVGGRVGAEAVKVLLSVEPGEGGAVSARSKLLRIPRRVPSPARVQRSLDLVRKNPKEVDSTEWTFAKEIVLLDASVKREPVTEVEVQAIQVGPVAFVSNPAELFVEFGLDLKKRSPFPLTFPVELANGCVGYVPTEEALGPHGGGYETRLTSYSNLEPAAGRQMVETGLDLVHAMRPGKIPLPRPAPPFSQPWSYGNLPPELE
jgi:hypothetical protein